MLGGVDGSSGVEVLEDEDFERRSRNVEPEAVGLADEGGRVNVNGVENVVL